MRGTYRRARPAMLTASVRIDGAVEREIRRGVAGDDGLRRFDPHFGALGRRYFLIPAIIFDHRATRGEAVVRVGGGATATGRKRDGHWKAPLLYVHTVFAGVELDRKSVVSGKSGQYG